MKKILIPLVIVLVAVAIAMIVVRSKKRVQPRARQATARAVTVIEVQPQTVQMTVLSQGEVAARTTTTLSAEVAGRVVSVSPKFVSGGFFNKGETLLSLDARDYEYVVKQAELGVAQAELALQTEIQQGEIAVAEWRKINDNRGDPPALVSRQPQRVQAEAALAAAEASLQQAKLNLRRTIIRAPYIGRVRAKSADIGQYVAPGMTIGSIYAIDYAEVRLAIPDSDLAFMDIPFAYRDDRSHAPGPAATLRGSFAGGIHEWQGRLSRLEGELDSATRMAFAVVRVEDPYHRDDTSDRPPLTVGMFVDVEIAGRAFEGVYSIPRSALRDNSVVAIVDTENRLRFRTVAVLRKSGEVVYLRSGLSPGDRVCTSSLDAAADGMLVTPFQENDGKRRADNE